LDFKNNLVKFKDITKLLNGTDEEESVSSEHKSEPMMGSTTPNNELQKSSELKDLLNFEEEKTGFEK
jgi:hypothetical protein